MIALDVVAGALRYTTGHAHGERVARALEEVRNAVEAPVQAWGCWLKWYECGHHSFVGYGYQFYWVGARCALGCHFVERFIPLLDVREEDWDGLLGSIAHDMITVAAVGHALGSGDLPVSKVDA